MTSSLRSLPTKVWIGPSIRLGREVTGQEAFEDALVSYPPASHARRPQKFLGEFQEMATEGWLQGPGFQGSQDRR